MSNTHHVFRSQTHDWADMIAGDDSMDFHESIPLTPTSSVHESNPVTPNSSASGSHGSGDKEKVCKVSVLLI